MLLSGWKQIAEFLRCGERTAQRWHSQFGLPVRNAMPYQNRGPVLASSEELDVWLQGARKPHPALKLEAHPVVLRHTEIVTQLTENICQQQRILALIKAQRAGLREVTSDGVALVSNLGRGLGAGEAPPAERKR